MYETVKRNGRQAEDLAVSKALVDLDAQGTVEMQRLNMLWRALFVTKGLGQEWPTARQSERATVRFTNLNKR